MPPKRLGRNPIANGQPQTKRIKVEFVSVDDHALPYQKAFASIPFDTESLVLTLGVGDTGQLGLGPDLTERTRPAKLPASSLEEATGLLNENDKLANGFVQICAGGMHTVALMKSPNFVFTFGCNDEGALGRVTSEGHDKYSKDEVHTKSKENKNRPKKKKKLDDEKYNSLGLSSAVLSNMKVLEESRPGVVHFPFKIKIVMVSAGDSHTSALDDHGGVWLWGTFRGSSGPIGLLEPGEICRFPKRLQIQTEGSRRPLHRNVIANNIDAQIPQSERIVKITSGQDHLVCLSEDGRLYTMGSAEQGQLGRIAERFCQDGGRSGISLFLCPAECRVRGSVRFRDVWAGGFGTLAQCASSGAIYACGLNNYGQLALKPSLSSTDSPAETKSSKIQTTSDGNLHNAASRSSSPETGSVGHLQLGLEGGALKGTIGLLSKTTEQAAEEAALVARQGPLVQFMLTRAEGFVSQLGWRQFALSMHHTLGLDQNGKVFAVGRFDYGRLGIGPIPPNDGICNASSCCIPQPVLGPLSDRRCITIGCGEAVSFAVSEDGLAYSWGMGSSQQLGHGDDDGDCYEPTEMIGKNLENRRIIMVDAGGQHCVLLASRPSVTEGATGNLSGPNDVSTSFQNSSRCSPPRSAAHKPSATDSAAATGPTSFSTHTNATTHSDQENGEDRMELDHPIDSLAQLGVPIIVIDGKSVTRYQCNFQEETCHHHSYPSQATGLPCETIEDKELPRSQKQAVSEPVALEGEMANRLDQIPGAYGFTKALTGVYETGKLHRSTSLGCDSTINGPAVYPIIDTTEQPGSPTTWQPLSSGRGGRRGNGSRRVNSPVGHFPESASSSTTTPTNRNPAPPPPPPPLPPLPPPPLPVSSLSSCPSLLQRRPSPPPSSGLWGGCGGGGGAESTTASTAGATINSSSSLHSASSSGASDSGSIGSTASHSDCFTLGSSSSCCSSGQFNSARSTDGGGSSRRSSLGHASSCQSIVVVSNLLPAATASLATTAPSTVCNAPTTNLAPFPTSTTSTSFASESIGVTLSPSPSPATSSASSASPCPSPSPPAPAPAPSPATVRQLPTQPSHGPHTFAQATGHSSPPRSICFLASPGGHSSSPLGCSSASGNITSAAAQQGQTAFSASTVSGGDIITPVSVAASRLIYAASSASASASLGGASPIDLADYEPSM